MNFLEAGSLNPINRLWWRGQQGGQQGGQCFSPAGEVVGSQTDIDGFSAFVAVLDVECSAVRIFCVKAAGGASRHNELAGVETCDSSMHANRSNASFTRSHLLEGTECLVQYRRLHLPRILQLPVPTTAVDDGTEVEVVSHFGILEVQGHDGSAQPHVAGESPEPTRAFFVFATSLPTSHPQPATPTGGRGPGLGLDTSSVPIAPSLPSSVHDSAAGSSAGLQQPAPQVKVYVVDIGKQNFACLKLHAISFVKVILESIACGVAVCVRYMIYCC